MGKKARKEREEKRESFAAKRSKEKRKTTLIAAGVFGVVPVIVGFSVYQFMNISSSAPGAPPGAGRLGDAHENIALLVRIFGDKFDFSGPAFQIKSSWIHFEGGNGNVIHKHSTGVTMGYLFETLGITLTDECYIFPNGREFCTNEDYSLKFYINHEKVPGILDYVGSEGDRVLISYGNETPEQIDFQLRELDN